MSPMTRKDKDRENRASIALAAALIVPFEGFSATAYQRPGDIPTIGYGHTSRAGGPKVYLGMPRWTRAYALKVLMDDLRRVYAPAVFAMNLPLRRRMAAALISFAYNLGPGYFGSGFTMGEALRAHRWDDAAAAFVLYAAGPPGTREGLLRRRRAEATVFRRGLNAAKRAARRRRQAKARARRRR